MYFPMKVFIFVLLFLGIELKLTLELRGEIPLQKKSRLVSNINVTMEDTVHVTDTENFGSFVSFLPNLSSSSSPVILLAQHPLFLLTTNRSSFPSPPPCPPSSPLPLLPLLPQLFLLPFNLCRTERKSIFATPTPHTLAIQRDMGPGWGFPSSLQPL